MLNIRIQMSKTTESKPLGVRIKYPIRVQLDQVCEKTGLSYTDVVTQALNEYLPKVLKDGKVTIVKRIAV